MASQDVELKDDKVSIIGCGYFGSSWLMLYVRGGYRVSVYDVSSDNMRASLAQIRTELYHLEENGHGKEGFTAEQQFERITICSSVEECVRNSILVQASP
ncbi:lambda-crystallin homolog [Gigantopelta aegis]|uniref:lambda-crystallin homolog n=1 Tax=Gigantopelta aegis TaxID=1735272 RepID=UPI001B88B65F|nr:lambda-crystallin homolog [Gigantopelta aegis]